MVAMNPQTWDAGRRARSSRAATCSTTPPSRCRPRSSATTSTSSACRSPRSATPTYTDPRQRQLFKNIIYVGALSALLDIDPEVIETAVRRAVQGQGKAARRQRQGAASRPRLRACSTCDARLGAAGAPRRRGRRPHLRRRQRRRRAGRGLRRRDGLRLVSDHAVLLAGRGFPELLQAAARRPGDRQDQLRHRPGRGRARLDRHRHRRRLERRARVHRHLRPRHLADDRVHRPRLLRRDPGRDHRRAARRPVDRHADAHAAVRPAVLRLRLARRHQARAAVPRRPARVLRVRRRGARPRRSAADADLRHDRPRHRHEPPAVRSRSRGTSSAPTTAAR